MEEKNNRIWEVDFLRGTAIILMVLFHLLYDLNEFYGYKINYQEGYINLIGKSSALLFISISALSCSLSSSNFKRGLKILLLAFAITLITYIYDANTYINFGILHLIGTSILFYKFFKPFNAHLLLIMGTIIIIIGGFFSKTTIPTNFFFPFGLTNSSYTSLDYYPLFPYFGVFLYGMAFVKIFYPHKKSLLNFNLANNLISYLGQHSLAIYLIHQPILLGILYLLAKVGIISKT